MAANSQALILAGAGLGALYLLTRQPAAEGGAPGELAGGGGLVGGAGGGGGGSDAGNTSGGSDVPNPSERTTAPPPEQTTTTSDDGTPPGLIPNLENFYYDNPALFGLLETGLYIGGTYAAAKLASGGKGKNKSITDEAAPRPRPGVSEETRAPIEERPEPGRRTTQPDEPGEGLKVQERPADADLRAPRARIGDETPIARVESPVEGPRGPTELSRLTAPDTPVTERLFPGEATFRGGRLPGEPVVVAARGRVPGAGAAFEGLALAAVAPSVAEAGAGIVNLLRGDVDAARGNASRSASGLVSVATEFGSLGLIDLSLTTDPATGKARANLGVGMTPGLVQGTSDTLSDLGIINNGRPFNPRAASDRVVAGGEDFFNSLGEGVLNPFGVTSRRQYEGEKNEAFLIRNAKDYQELLKRDPAGFADFYARNKGQPRVQEIIGVAFNRPQLEQFLVAQRARSEQLRAFESQGYGAFAPIARISDATVTPTNGGLFQRQAPPTSQTGSYGPAVVQQNAGQLADAQAYGNAMYLSLTRPALVAPARVNTRNETYNPRTGLVEGSGPTSRPAPVPRAPDPRFQEPGYTPQRALVPAR